MVVMIFLATSRQPVHLQFSQANQQVDENDKHDPRHLGMIKSALSCTVTPDWPVLTKYMRCWGPVLACNHHGVEGTYSNMESPEVLGDLF